MHSCSTQRTLLPHVCWLSRTPGAPAAAATPAPAARSRFRPQAAAALRRAARFCQAHPPHCYCRRLAGPCLSWRCPQVCRAASREPTPARLWGALQGRTWRVWIGGKDKATSHAQQAATVTAETATMQTVPASQPASQPSQALGCTALLSMLHPCTLPSVRSPSGSGSGGRQRGGVGLGIGTERPSAWASAAAVRPGRETQVA